MITKKGKDLKVGDIVVGHGLVMNIELDPKPGGVFDGKPNIGFFDINDSYYGPGHTWLDVDTDFEVYDDRKNIVRCLRIIDCDLAKYIADMMETRRKFHKIEWNVIHKLNLKKRKKKV